MTVSRIAWATLEHLHEVNRVRGLFATHYHELTALAGKLGGVRNATVAVKEWDGEVIFLHEVRPGAADRSYGVQVAQLAGLPPAVVAGAPSRFSTPLEAGERDRSRPKALIDDLPLFAAVAEAPAPAQDRTEPDRGSAGPARSRRHVPAGSPAGALRSESRGTDVKRSPGFT